MLYLNCNSKNPKKGEGNMEWMTLFITSGKEVSRTDPLDSFEAALEAARCGPSGANFSIVCLAKNSKNDRQVLEGTVPQR